MRTALPYDLIRPRWRQPTSASRRSRRSWAAREGTRQVDTLLSFGCSAGKSQPTPRPLCLLDGARVDSFNGVQTLAMRQLETVTGTAATARYGADGANGVVIASTT